MLSCARTVSCKIPIRKIEMISPAMAECQNLGDLVVPLQNDRLLQLKRNRLIVMVAPRSSDESWLLRFRDQPVSGNTPVSRATHRSRRLAESENLLFPPDR